MTAAFDGCEHEWWTASYAESEAVLRFLRGSWRQYDGYRKLPPHLRKRGGVVVVCERCERYVLIDLSGHAVEAVWLGGTVRRARYGGAVLIERRVGEAER